MEIDVDHAADSPFEVPLGQSLVDGVLQVLFARQLGQLSHRSQVLKNETHLSGDEQAIDRQRKGSATSAASRRATYCRSISKYGRKS